MEKKQTLVPVKKKKKQALNNTFFDCDAQAVILI